MVSMKYRQKETCLALNTGQVWSALANMPENECTLAEGLLVRKKNLAHLAAFTKSLV